MQDREHQGILRGVHERLGDIGSHDAPCRIKWSIKMLYCSHKHTRCVPQPSVRSCVGRLDRRARHGRVGKGLPRNGPFESAPYPSPPGGCPSLLWGRPLPALDTRPWEIGGSPWPRKTPHPRRKPHNCRPV
jgi:hypothetical protein